VWAVGVVLYQMLAGRRPFEGKDDLAVVSSILDETPPPIGTLRPGLPDQLQRIVACALDKNLTNRYSSGTELLAALTACHAEIARGRLAPATISQLVRRPLVAVSTVVVLAAVIVPAALAYRRASYARWARDEGIPQIMQLVAKDDYAGAFALAKEVDRQSPNDPLLANLWPQFSVPGSIITAPDGADVYVQPYAADDDRWEHLGRTPLRGVRLPRAVLKFRVEKNGFEPQTLAARNPSSLLQNSTNRLAKAITISLLPKGTTSEMAPVPGGAFPVALSGFSTDALVALDRFTIDRFEVSNKAFKQFVDSGGYSKRDAWNELTFVMDGRDIEWSDAIRRFHDSSDKPGPAAWEVGQYPIGQDDYPVGGVSWYEAVAYCRSVGKTLPTLFHWTRAALAPDEMFAPLAPSIILASNYSLKGPVRVGSARGVGPYGTYDMGGNVREWAWNESEGGRRWILGGAWHDPDWMLIQRNSLPPFDRSATNGFRCARYTAADLPAQLTARVQIVTRDARSAKAVSDEVYEVFKRQFSYVKSALNERTESTDTTNKDWTKLRISFDAGRDNARVPVVLYLPRNVGPPYQIVLVFPGLSAFVGSASSENLQPQLLDFIVKSGRAMVQPIYKGSYERWDTFLNLQGEDAMRTLRARMLEWREEVGRTLDLMAGRTDIDMQRVAYVGVSFGASMPLPILALEDRFKTAVLLAPGFPYRTVPPEADAVNYVSHVTMPVLMIGGRQDYVLPLEEAQKPLYERLGTPVEHKRHVIFDAGHVGDYPRGQTVREVLAWLDRYLGPVTSSHP
jgi:formylglycine-generating enzyme required for sulfatase activity/predicted esterase